VFRQGSSWGLCHPRVVVAAHVTQKHSSVRLPNPAMQKIVAYRNDLRNRFRPLSFQGLIVCV
jgi:hypothetical protein